MDSEVKVLNNKSGQLTIFVIAAILIVAIVGLFFLFRTGLLENIGIGGAKTANVNAFLSSCIEEKTREGIKEISLRGGDLNPQLYTTFLFTAENAKRNISYLCYTQNNFRPCVVQKPTLFVDVENEIHDYIEEDLNACFSEMLANFRDDGFDVDSNSKLNNFKVDFSLRKVILKTDSEVTLEKSGETTTQENFEIIVPSRLYELLGIAQEVINQEAQFCYFEDTGFEITYPEFSVDKQIIASGNLIYTLENLNSKEIFRFAVRSCSIPPGF